MEIALNCCDRLINDKIIKDKYSVIYIGSYFCCHFFCKIDFDELIKIIPNNCKIVLVVPPVTQKYYHKVIELVDSIINKYNIDELCVNDFGMLSYFFDKVNYITAGRFFFKDMRDLRYEKFFSMKKNPNIETSYMMDLLKKYNIRAIELDPCWEELDITEISKKVNVGIHYPYVYLSHGNICEYASIHKNIDKKFRTSANCNLECTKFLITIDKENNHFVKICKGICADISNKDINIIGDNYRKIVFEEDYNFENINAD